MKLVGPSWPSDDSHLDETIRKLEFVEADLRQASRMAELVQDTDVIFNLAGRSGAVASNESPLDDLGNNCGAHLTLLEACRHHNPRVKIVFPSSRLVYSPEQHLPVPETATTNPVSLYGVHKLAVEKYHLLYAHLYGLNVVILRITNPFGPHQRAGQNRYGIINWFIQTALAGGTLPIYGDGRQLRDYIYIDDVVKAMMLAGLSETANNRVFNIGSGSGVRLIDAAQMIVRLANSGAVRHLEWPGAVKKAETGDFVADIGSITDALGWRPAASLEDGLVKIMTFYRKATNGSR